MRSKKNKKKLMIAISLGMVATMGVFSMMNNQKASIEAKLAQEQANALAAMQSQQSPAPAPQEETTNVILAKTDIKTGDIITLSKIEKKEYKKTELPPVYFVNENYVLGKIASQDILMGKILTDEDILATSANSINIPPDMRAITIPTSLIQGLASYIYVGSRIDLIAIKSPPDFIAQNLKIIALEFSPDMQASMNAAPSAAPAAAPAAPPAAAPATPGAAPAAAPAATPAAAPVAAPSPAIASAGKMNVSADKATGITVLVPVSTAKKVIDAMISGKLQVITRGNNDNKIYKQHSSFNINSVKTTSILPPPPSGTEKLPSLPGIPGSSSSPPMSVEKPKIEVEVIEASNKRQVSFDDTSNNNQRTPSKDLKDLLKMSN